MKVLYLIGVLLLFSSCTEDQIETTVMEGEVIEVNFSPNNTWSSQEYHHVIDFKEHGLKNLTSSGKLFNTGDLLRCEFPEGSYRSRSSYIFTHSINRECERIRFEEREK